MISIFLRLFTVTLGNSVVGETLLKPPGLRPKKDPFIVIPMDQPRPNQPPNLQIYRAAFGKPAKGWAGETIDIRRFSCDQRGVIYYRVSDLVKSHILKTSNASKTHRIWPVGTIIILESYKRNTILSNRAKPIAIDTMKKVNDPKGSDYTFFPVNWS